MILSDREIEAAIKAGQLLISPEPEQVMWSSTAVDLTLDGGILIWKEPKRLPTGAASNIYPFGDDFNIRSMMRDQHYAEDRTIGSDGYVLGPKSFILGYTREAISLPKSSRIAARVEGKSSLARLGVGVHVTAPTIHAGFGFNPQLSVQKGTPIQLEIFNLGNQNVVLEAGMPICQLIFEEVREVPRQGYEKQFSDQTKFTGSD